MIEIGRVYIKIAGRDAGQKCVVVDILDDTYVLIDGSTRRRKCNIAHLEPLNETVKISKGADSAAVESALAPLNIVVRKTKPKQAGERPKQVRKGKSVEEKKAILDAKKAKKKPVKKEAKKESVETKTE